MVEHPAVKAWRELQPQRIVPCRIHELKEEDKSAVYRLDGVGAQGSAVIAKLNREGGLLVERTIYEDVLPDVPVPALHYYGFVAEQNGRDCWLFLEDAGGEAYASANTSHRRLAGHWLARVHTSMAGMAVAARLPDRGPAHYRDHVRSARDTIMRYLSNPVLTDSDASELTALVVLLQALEARWDHVEGCCTAMPRTLVHGDFQARNMRVRMSRRGLTLFPFDWELAGWGVPAPDLDQSTGQTACVDLTAYWSGVRKTWPHYEVHDIQEWAVYGQLFRLVASIHWHSLELAYEWVDALMYKMRFYRVVLAQVIQRMYLSSHAPGWKA
jgi:aminoglycoside phosphotransferase (APT) family kinase protein